MTSVTPFGLRNLAWSGLDADVVEWLKSYGPGYQTKANMLLRHAMRSTQAASRRKRRRA